MKPNAASFGLQVVGRKMRRRSARAQERMGDLTSMLQETTSGARVVRAFGAEPYERERFAKANQAFSLLNYFRAAATYKDRAEVGVYYLRSWSQDKPPLTQLQDADMLVWGFDGRVGHPPVKLAGRPSLILSR